MVGMQIKSQRPDRKPAAARIPQGIVVSLDVTRLHAVVPLLLDRDFDGAEDTLANVLRKARFREVHAGESFNDRQREVDNRLLNGFEGKLTSSRWANLAKCSHDTAHRDINDLVNRGDRSRNRCRGRVTCGGFCRSAKAHNDLSSG